MSVHRHGISLGEGAALFLVTGDADGVQLLGAGASSDAYHMSAPEPNGLGAEQCMRAALEDAQIGPGQISYLNLHGTGTPQNDAMESAAIERVLGTSVPCSSTKPLVGHTLGAAGALEVGLCWLVLANAEAGRLQLPPHRWDGCVDPKLPPLRFTERGDRLDAGVPALVMSNAFGFGGSNCSIVLRGPAA
jgi:3-oxoacyl-[acyl-carrier-protein] synthase-1